MSPVIWFLAGLFELLLSAFTRPDRVQCGKGTYLLGVRPSGSSQCIQAPPGNGQDECVRGKGGQDCQFSAEQNSYPVAIVCTGAKRPAVTGPREARCL